MIYAKIACAAVGLAAAVLVGVSLGDFTTSGFVVREPVDVIGDAAAPRMRKESLSVDTVPPSRVEHVCRGCDAKLYRENAWYSTDTSYEAHDEWAREEKEDRDAVRGVHLDPS